MKTIALALTLALSASAAIAADAVYEPPVAPEAVVVAPVFSWTGARAGIQGGYGWTKLLDVEEDDEYKLDGGIVGGFVGYDYQFENNFVLGIEGDLDYNFGDTKPREDFLDTVEIGTELGGSVRARVGYALDRTLIYATGGWATVKAYQEDRIANEVVFKESETFNGWTVGAGVEHAFTDNLFGRLEYRYNDFGSKTGELGKIELDQHTVKAGLGVKF
jgi:outer membrane immunogenic protein